MTHPRTQLRAVFRARLLNVTAAEDRVYKGRLMPIEEPQLPAIVIHTRDAEEVQERSPSGWNGFERRRCIVSVVGIVQSFDDIDDELDTMAQEVEAALQGWTIPGFESADAELLDTKSDDPEFDGALTTGATTLRYAVTYQTPYRDCSNPYVDEGAAAGDGALERSGAYPGGQVTPGCPAGNTGEACPIGEAQLFAQEEPIN
jgi:hypothetical protein